MLARHPADPKRELVLVAQGRDVPGLHGENGSDDSTAQPGIRERLIGGDSSVVSVLRDCVP